MTFNHKVGLALQMAREKSRITLTQADLCIHQKFNTAPDSLSRWERGESLPPSRIVLDLLTLYQADIYRFMELCGIEEAGRVSDPEI